MSKKKDPFWVAKDDLFGKKILSDFEKNVFKAVLRIPLGQTRSYAWVAQQIGRPKAVRAVGQALKKNPCLIIIPCHRVIRSDGSLGGYAKGREKKRTLLNSEKYFKRQFLKK